MKCPVCGANNPAGDAFCSNCGYDLYNSTNDTGTSQPEQSALSNQNAADTVANDEQTHIAHTSTTPGSTTSSSLLQPSMRLQNGRYEIVKILGQGGMGAAVLAHDTRIANKPVVIKELISDENDPQQRQEDVDNFKREVATLATLDHPLIPTVTDSFQEGSRYYMVQEYAPGENLEAYLENHKDPMPEQEALTYISQVLDILDYLGKRKPPIIHRDIKPANIIISSKDKRARLVDFGIARADEAKNAVKRKQTSALGTPGYAPPEQYQGNADTRSDLYALAATLHHLVTGRDPQNEPPFNYPPARTINPKVSPELERLLEHALTLDITKRYQSADEMKDDVDEILQQRFHSTGDTSSYVLKPSRPIGISGTKQPPRTATKVSRPPAAQADTVDQAYQGGYQARPNRPNPPPFRDVHEADPFAYREQGQQYSERYGEQQQQMMPPRQEQRYYAPPPFPMSSPQQNSSNYLKISFAILVIVLVVIALLLFLIGGGGGAYPIH